MNHLIDAAHKKSVDKSFFPTLAVGLLDRQPNIPIGEEHQQEAGILRLLSTLSVLSVLRTPVWAFNPLTASLAPSCHATSGESRTFYAEFRTILAPNP